MMHPSHAVLHKNYRWPIVVIPSTSDTGV